jgi:hypothetical protein
VDFNKTFAHVAKFITIRCILALGTAKDLEIHQMDVKKRIFYWNIGGGYLYESTKGFCTRGQRKPCMQTQENFVWA